jgi:hypothetical protein
MSAANYALDIMELRQSLGERSAVTADRFLRPEFQDIRHSAYTTVNEGALGAVLESRAVQSYVARFFLKEYLVFAFAKRPRDVRDGRGVWQHIPGGSVNIVGRRSSPLEISRPAGHEIANAAIYVERNYLVDCLGLKVDNLPEQCQDFFRGRPDAHFMFSIVLSSRSCMTLDAIFRCPMAQPLKSIYLRAKYDELLAETVDVLNRSGRAYPEHSGKPPSWGLDPNLRRGAAQ